jgi:hypothetical protein
MRIIFFLIIFPTGFASAQKGGHVQNVCNVIKRPIDCSMVEQNAKQLLLGNDNCVIALIDSLYTNIIRTSNKEYLVALDSIVVHSDGYVSDYLEEIGVKLFYNKLPTLAHYLMGHDGKKRQAFERLIIESMSSELSDTGEPGKKRKKIAEFVEKKKRESKINEDEYKYIQTLMKRFDPKISE